MCRERYGLDRVVRTMGERGSDLIYPTSAVVDVCRMQRLRPHYQRTLDTRRCNGPEREAWRYGVAAPRLKHALRTVAALLRWPW